jgi:Secretion system C-terminal sorting domain
MRMTSRYLLIAGLLLIGVTSYGQSTGATPCDAIDLYPSGIGDCGNSCGAQLCGEYQCETAGCNSIVMAGTATVDGSCTTDNDVGQPATWIAVTATATDLVIENTTNYSGPGASTIEEKDYTIFSGPCNSLTEIGCTASVSLGGTASFTGLTVGDTYFIQVTQSSASFASCPTCNNAGACAQSSVPFVPSNDNCAGAQNMTSGVTVNTTNADATVGTDLAVCLNPASGSVENSVWFVWCAPGTWIAGDSAYVTVFNQTCNATQGLQMSVYGAGESCATIAAGTATSDVCENPGTTSNYYFSWVANPGECFYVIMDGFAGTACNFDIQINDAPILPVLLSSFNIYRESNITLVWEMKSEIDNAYFKVSFSEDGKTFFDIAEVPSIGNHSSAYVYEYEDLNRRDEGGYYQISQTDLNGSTTILSTAYLKGINNQSAGKLNVYPNPASQEMSIEFLNSGEQGIGQMIIYSLRGEEISASNKLIKSGLNLFNYNLEELADGPYIIKMIFDDSVWNSKFNVRH